MKITQMLKREDFYTINEKTLATYFHCEEQITTDLYIYPQLNAIVTKKPSKQVVDYLLCEYSVRDNPIKWLAVRCYVLLCMHSLGLLSAKKCTVQSTFEAGLLVYPCNKKYRIFHFTDKTVDVISKNGFDASDLQHEIAFRRQACLPDFVPEIVSWGENRYRERIIDGRPLARITENYDTLRDLAYERLTQYGESQRTTVKFKSYAEKQRHEIILRLKQKAKNHILVEKIVNQIITLGDAEAQVVLTFSHGDLQPGNIWIENNTGRIYIIDWESWGTRSVWYDKATLYQGLRPGEIRHYLNIDVPVTERATVLLEDIVFRLNELNSLPSDYGMIQFIEYCNGIAQWLRLGEKYDE